MRNETLKSKIYLTDNSKILFSCFKICSKYVISIQIRQLTLMFGKLHAKCLKAGGKNYPHALASTRVHNAPNLSSSHELRPSLLQPMLCSLNVLRADLYLCTFYKQVHYIVIRPDKALLLATFCTQVYPTRSYTGPAIRFPFFLNTNVHFSQPKRSRQSTW